jgi:hypothetical protein
MLSFIVLCLILLAVFGFLLWLGLRARKGRVNVTTHLGASYELLNKDQRKAAETIVNRAADKKTEEQSSSDPE